MGNALKAIQWQSLGSTSNSVTFSSIPSIYRDLVIVINGQISSNSSITYIYNGDTGANYASVDMRGATFGTASFGATSRNYNDTAYNNFDANTRIGIRAEIYDYAQTNKHKSSLVRSNGTLTDGMVIAMTNRWANTAAITSITINTTAGSFAIGSTFALYGIQG
jgi:hypothetical protein